MICEYFGKCGGCSLGHLNYEEQLNLKIQKEKDRFKNIYNSKFNIIKSKDSNFRNRVEFRIFHKSKIISYAMNDINKKLLPIKNCNIAILSITELMPLFLKEIIKSEILSKKFFSVEFLSSNNGDMVVTMIYHTKLNDNWINEAKKLEQKLDIKIIGRSKKQKIILSDDYIDEKSFFHMRYFENSFIQPNQEVNIQMIKWVINNIEAKDDLCELYCGNGNFTLPLSKKFNKILATEISKVSIKNAKINCKLNNINNIKFVRLSSQEFIEAKNKVREFRRLKQENINLDDYNFSTIFVDPPRAGLDELTRKFASTFNQIIYISCNPETLYNDLEFLNKTHTIKFFALFDQFAYTTHIECGVILIKDIQIV
jgi:tRNA (uracil-5-)-methyltransferase